MHAPNETAIKEELAYFTEQKINPDFNNKYTVMLHTSKGDYDVIHLRYIELLRDYNGNTADDLKVCVDMQVGDYMHCIHYFKDNLEVSIKTHYGLEDVFGKEKTVRYKGIIVNATKLENLPIAGDEPNSLNDKYIPLIIQCLDLEYEALRLVYADGVYKETTVEDIIRSEIFDGCKECMSNGKPVLDSGNNIDIYPPNNTQQIPQVIIPTGIKLIDLPSFLQNTQYGVYNANIGTYLQKYHKEMNEEPISRLFVYPLYDTDRFNNGEGKKLIIIIPDNQLFKYSEYTLATEGDNIRVMAAEIQTNDNGENDMISKGAGYTYNNPSSILSGNVDITDEEITADHTTSMDNLTMKERRDGVSDTLYISNTNNLYNVRSDYLLRGLTNIIVTWFHCNVDLIYPGMPVMLMRYIKKTEITKVYGIVQGTYYRWDGRTKSSVGAITIKAEKQAVYNEQEGEEKLP